jgi:hypothetical protein
MKHLVIILFACFPAAVQAQAQEEKIIHAAPDTISREGLTLYFIDEERSFSESYKKRIVDMYFLQYPKLLKKYNDSVSKKVVFFIDKTYSGVAEAGNGRVRFNPAWFASHPEDVDVVTHELMHIVQNYRGNKIPSWVTEGVADYVRAMEGVNNHNSQWALPDLKPDHHYTSSYRITARFFVWITKKYKSDFVNQLDKAARANRYSDAVWAAITGKTLEELWTEYKASPSIQ